MVSAVYCDLCVYLSLNIELAVWFAFSYTIKQWRRQSVQQQQKQQLNHSNDGERQRKKKHNPKAI